MAHVKKYTQGALHNMLAHYDRTAKNSRENIDPSLTHLNYNLAAKCQPLPHKKFKIKYYVLKPYKSTVKKQIDLSGFEIFEEN